MSIVIKGVDIPKRHYVKGYYIDGDGNVLDISRKRIIGKATKLPSHSRLIDAKQLKEKVLKWMPPDPCGVEEKEYPFETDICVSMLMEIDEAPTIIESEVEG